MIVAYIKYFNYFCRRPQYNMAIDVPLNLFKCTYDLEDTSNWLYDSEELKSVIENLQKMWTIHNIKFVFILIYINKTKAGYL